MPFLDAPPIPANKPRGIDTTNAHGQDTIRNIDALYIHSLKVASLTTKGGIIASAKAKNTTIGVYTFANFVINFSVGAFLFEAFSTNSKILETVDSLKFLLTLTFKTPLVLIHPAKISSFIDISLGTDSPVKAEVSIKLVPSITIPSNGTLSPGLTIISSSILTVSGFTFSSTPLLITFA